MQTTNNSLFFPLCFYSLEKTTKKFHYKQNTKRLNKAKNKSERKRERERTRERQTNMSNNTINNDDDGQASQNPDDVNDNSFSDNPRERLPAIMFDRSKNSIWSIVKQCVDKELYRFTIPVIWNEPLSLLQRMSENTRYISTILDKAAGSQDPIERIKLIATFIVSGISLHTSRLSKPFNPLLGETYELVRDDYRIMCEQVSHHPPISAHHCQSNKGKWSYYGSVLPQMKINYLNASVEAMPEGIQTVELTEFGEVYTWHNVKVSAHNLVLGKLWFEYTGQAEIINHKLKIKCVLEFKPYSWFTRLLNRVDGYVLDQNSTKVSILSGQWDQYLYSCDNVNNTEFMTNTLKLLPGDQAATLDYINKKRSADKIQLLWRNDNTDPILAEYYNFTKFTCCLNELTDKLKTLLPRTDSRLRPDIRDLESGRFDQAADEKNRLEEKQRAVRRKVQAGELPATKTMWFNKQNHKCTGEETWVFTNEYWKRDFAKCPDIY
jgi:hypothetical protein